LVAVPFLEVPLPTYNQAQFVAVSTDAEIIAWVEGAPDPSAWYWGLMACYGLRPHEIECAVLIERDLCQVAEGTKTGFRTVVLLPREWVERFGLKDRRCTLLASANRSARGGVTSIRASEGVGECLELTFPETSKKPHH